MVDSQLRNRRSRRRRKYPDSDRPSTPWILICTTTKPPRISRVVTTRPPALRIWVCPSLNPRVLSVISTIQ